MSWLTILGLAVGGALLLEGMAYALMPGVMGKAAEAMRDAGPGMMQAVGVVFAVVGAVIVSVVLRGLG